MHGLKPTDQRVRVAEILMSQPTHMTAEQILATLRQGGDKVSKATVYNTLKVLAECGLVRQIHLDPERSVYDSTRAPHHHFHDLDTCELLDIPPQDIAFSRFPALPEGMEAESVEVGIRPEHLSLVADDADGLPLDVTTVEALGVETYLHGTLGDGQLITVRLQGNVAVHPGTTVRIAPSGEEVYFFEPDEAGRVIM